MPVVHFNILTMLTDDGQRLVALRYVVNRIQDLLSEEKLAMVSFLKFHCKISEVDEKSSRNAN